MIFYLKLRLTFILTEIKKKIFKSVILKITKLKHMLILIF